MLRDYQQKLKSDVYAQWDSGKKNVLAVLPTGGGKTKTFSDIIHDHSGVATCAIAHRQELVSQISIALAREGVRHRIVGPKNVVKLINNLHMEEFGHSFYDPSSRCAVAGVDTLIRRKKELGSWSRSVGLWVQDEAHHVLQSNKWGEACDMFPNAKGLGVTATPLRADGKGLGAHSDGVFHSLVEGPSMRELIMRGYLTDYRIFAPPSDLDLSDVKISASTGDYTLPGVAEAVKKSHVIGDVVEHYIKIAMGMLGITFAPNVAIAQEIADNFNARGIPAAVVSADTEASERNAILKKFRKRELLQLINVDLFGEGFDVPSVEVVSMARPTQSYGLYVQQFGRALRILEGKKFAIIIDHVGNVMRHGLPDAMREWSLDAREKRGKSNGPSDAIPVRACHSCTMVYERIHAECPYCGHKPIMTIRSGPEFVDGSLSELDPEVLAHMRGEIEKINMSVEDYRLDLMRRRVPEIGQMAQVKRHVEKQQAQNVLRDTIALWAGYQRHFGRPDEESYRRFYFRYGIDVMSAQALGTKEAIKLNDMIRSDL